MHLDVQFHDMHCIRNKEGFQPPID
jgi:hypothetical protein